MGSRRGTSDRGRRPSTDELLRAALDEGAQWPAADPGHVERGAPAAAGTPGEADALGEADAPAEASESLISPPDANPTAPAGRSQFRWVFDASPAGEQSWSKVVRRP